MKGVDTMNINELDIEYLIKDYFDSKFFELPSPVEVSFNKYLHKYGIKLNKKEKQNLIVMIRERI